MTAEHDHTPAVSAVGGPGWSGAAPASEADSRRAPDADTTPDAVDNEGPGRVGAPLPGDEQKTVGAPGDEQKPVAPGEGQKPLGTPGEAQKATGAPGEFHDVVDGAGVDHERKLEVDLDELVARAEKADHYLELAQRTKADFENYRKRAAREAAGAQERGVAKLALALLPAVDNLDRAVAAADSAAPEAGGGPVAPVAAGDGAATLVSGIKLVHADVIAALARVGIEPFSPQGEEFDPQHHEAVAQQPVAGTKPGTVAEVYQRGYRLGETVLRPARVLVAG